MNSKLRSGTLALSRRRSALCNPRSCTSHFCRCPPTRVTATHSRHCGSQPTHSHHCGSVCDSRQYLISHNLVTVAVWLLQLYIVAQSSRSPPARLHNLHGSSLPCTYLRCVVTGMVGYWSGIPYLHLLLLRAADGRVVVKPTLLQHASTLAQKSAKTLT